MSEAKNAYRIELDPKVQVRRKRYLYATIVTCLAAAMVFGAAHVVKLGANRMADMRSKAGYDLKDEEKHIRAAGEDIEAHRIHEEKVTADNVYELATIKTLISQEQWSELDKEQLIPAGSFLMGSSSERTDDYNRPEHTVKLDSYFIDKYPVTNIEYARFVAQTKHRSPLDWKQGKIPDNKYLHPVVMVSWYDASAFCAYENKRLPKESEWEKAARGTDGTRWPWGNKMDPSRLNTYYNVGSTTNVSRYPDSASGYGVVDMAGNVSEWTASEFSAYEGSSATSLVFQPKVMVESTTKDKGMNMGQVKTLKDSVYMVRRGGSWKSDPFTTSSYHRNFSFAHYASDFFGFRCVRDLGSSEPAKG